MQHQPDLNDPEAIAQLMLSISQGRDDRTGTPILAHEDAVGSSNISDASGSGLLSSTAADMSSNKMPRIRPCNPCRLRRTKCDTVKPVCGSCNRSNSGADCSYTNAPFKHIPFVLQRQRTANPCVLCRRSKKRCNGSRPQCGSCQIKNQPCEYIDNGRVDPIDILQSTLFNLDSSISDSSEASILDQIKLVSRLLDFTQAGNTDHESHICSIRIQLKVISRLIQPLLSATSAVSTLNELRDMLRQIIVQFWGGNNNSDHHLDVQRILESFNVFTLKLLDMDESSGHYTHPHPRKDSAIEPKSISEDSSALNAIFMALVQYEGVAAADQASAAVLPFAAEAHEPQKAVIQKLDKYCSACNKHFKSSGGFKYHITRSQGCGKKSSARTED